MSTQPNTVTALLADMRRGRADAMQSLFPLVYDELRGLARIQRRRVHASQTLNTTALVHEAYLKLVRGPSVALHDRAHFMAVAATAMRHILISYARRRTAAKRGGSLRKVSFDCVEEALRGDTGFDDVKAMALLALDRALSALSERSERQLRVVECRYFAGMSIEETSVALGISPATVKRDLSMAQAWLYRQMREELP